MFLCSSYMSAAYLPVTVFCQKANSSRNSSSWLTAVLNASENMPPAYNLQDIGTIIYDVTIQCNYS